jgi:hypothetical protein
VIMKMLSGLLWGCWLICFLSFVPQWVSSVDQEINSSEEYLTNPVQGPILITELMAQDNEIFPDEDLDYPDWLEIWNPTESAVNLKNWSLTDDPTDLRKWQFPELMIHPDEYLVIFASGKNRREAGTALHLNFSLDAKGEFLALVQPDGNTVSYAYSPAYPSQNQWISGISYGIGSLDTHVFFSEPSPGKANTDGRAGFVSKPFVSQPHGVFELPFTVQLLTSTAEAEIRYTTDGSEPTITHGTLYTDPIPITTTTTLRAAAFREQYYPSEVLTQTYIFLHDVLNQTRPAGYPTTWSGVPADYDLNQSVIDDPRYRETILDDLQSLPVMSLVMDPEDLFDPRRGIYFNSEQKGIAWERPGSIELFYPNGERAGFQVNSGVRMQGGYSRLPEMKKHSFRLLFKKEYGPGKLRYKLFDDSPVVEFDTINLRGNYNYTWHGVEGGFSGGVWSQDVGHVGKADYIRDEFSRRSQLALGQPAAHGTFVHLYLNGLYWGVYNLCERPDDNFAASYLGGEQEDWDVITGGTKGFMQTQVKGGDLQAFHVTMNLARQDLSVNANYEALRQYVDIDNLIDYMLVIFLAGNRDAPTIIGGGGFPWNYYSIRKREPGAGFKYFVWDAEWTLEEVFVNNVLYHKGTDTPGFIFYQAMNHPDFRTQVADRTFRHFFHEGALTAEANIARYSKLASLLDRAIVGESARWGDARSRRPRTRDDDWLPEVYRLLTEYFPYRSEIVVQQMREAGLYPPINPPEFKQRGGRVEAGFPVILYHVDHDGNPAEYPFSIYYTTDGSDPRQPGGGISDQAVLYTEAIPLFDSLSVRARAYDGVQWSALSEALFTVENLTEIEGWLKY